MAEGNVRYVGTGWSDLVATLEDLQAKAASGRVCALAVVAMLDEGLGTVCDAYTTGFAFRDVRSPGVGVAYFELVGAMEGLKYELLTAAQEARGDDD
jgi:hypothetical protein